MLRLQALVFDLELTQPLELGHRHRIGHVGPAHQYSVAHLLAPIRQHERVNAQGICDVLDLHPWRLAHCHGFEFELHSVLNHRLARSKRLPPGNGTCNNGTIMVSFRCKRHAHHLDLEEHP